MLRQKLDQYIRHYFGGQRNEGLDKHQLELLLQLPAGIEVLDQFRDAATRSLAALRSLPSVRVATPAVEAQAVLVYGTVRRSAALAGVVPELERAVTSLDTKIVRGSWAALSRTPDGVILGSQVARALGVDVGSHLQAVGPDGGGLPLKVVGIVASGLSQVDKTLALVNLPLAQGLAGLSTDQATTVRLALTDPVEATRVAREAEQRTGYVCRSWQEKNAASVEAFKRQNMITLALVLFTTLVAAFGVRWPTASRAPFALTVGAALAVVAMLIARGTVLA